MIWTCVSPKRSLQKTSGARSGHGLAVWVLESRQSWALCRVAQGLGDAEGKPHPSHWVALRMPRKDPSAHSQRIWHPQRAFMIPIYSNVVSRLHNSWYFVSKFVNFLQKWEATGLELSNSPRNHCSFSSQETSSPVSPLRGGRAETDRPRCRCTVQWAEKESCVDPEFGERNLLSFKTQT